jgi:tetrahydromethanopterin S-methyltransferase subunit C
VAHQALVSYQLGDSGSQFQNWTCGHLHQSRTAAGVCGAAEVRRLTRYGHGTPPPSQVVTALHFSIVKADQPWSTVRIMERIV